jgi:hypothetical protein
MCCILYLYSVADIIGCTVKGYRGAGMRCQEELQNTYVTYFGKTRKERLGEGVREREM